MDNDLFSSFPPTPDEAWEKQLQRELKGASYQEKLIWRAPEGLSDAPEIKPYYRRSQSLPSPLPGIDSGHRCTHRGIWDQDDLQGLLHAASQAASRDAAGMNVYLPLASIHKMQSGAESAALPIRWFAADFPNDNGNLSAANTLLDLLGQRALTGGAPELMDPGAWDLLARHVKNAGAKANNAGRTLYFDAARIANAGADIPTQLAAIWAAAHEMLSELSDRNLSLDSIASNLVIQVAAGPNFFFELAKFRAIRTGWALLAKAYSGQTDSLPQPEILATSVSWNLAASDAHNNLLRLTTEAASAILGGADTLCLPRFDVHLEKDSDFARRLSDNLALLLDKEAHLQRVADPAAGSWYLESLTEELGELGWKRFQEIESAGGFTAALQKCMLQQWIRDARQRKAASLSKPGSSWVGITRFQPGKSTDAIKSEDSPDYQGTFERIQAWDAEGELRLAALQSKSNASAS